MSTITHGLEVRSTAGSLQIHRSGQNYVFKRKQTIPRTAAGNFGNGDDYRAPVLGMDSLIFFRPPPGWEIAVSGNNYATGYNLHISLAVWGGNGGTLDVWEFAPAGETGETFGMKVWDANGRLTFNTTESTMHITGAAQGNADASPFVGDYAVPAAANGRTYGIRLFAIQSRIKAGTQTQLWTTAKLSGAQFLLNQRALAGSGTTGPIGDPNTGYMLADITDHL